MIVLVPLGGIGNRFKKENYKKPKALIDIYRETYFVLFN